MCFSVAIVVNILQRHVEEERAPPRGDTGSAPPKGGTRKGRGTKKTPKQMFLFLSFFTISPSSFFP